MRHNYLHPISDSLRLYLKKHYKGCLHRFPIIAGVIDERQKGFVFVDDQHNPGVFFVVHSFGFCQCVVIRENSGWEQKVIRFIYSGILAESVSKLRLYAVSKSLSLLLDKESASRSDRIKWKFSKTKVSESKLLRGFSVSEIDQDDLPSIDEFLDVNLSSRFWSSGKDYLQHGVGVVCKEEAGRVVGVCYSASISGESAEIDIMTSQDFRGQGIAKTVAEEFLRICLMKNISPEWDCYANNIPSVQLASSLGFEKFFTYRFYIVEL